MTTTTPISFPCPVTALGAPDPTLLGLARQSPVMEVVGPGGSRAWLVSSAELVREVLSEPERFSNMIDPSATNSRANLVVLDAPDHTRLRKLAVQAFTPRRVRALVPQVEAFVETLMDEMAEQGSPADIVTCLGQRLPSQVICAILGVPMEDQVKLRYWSDIFTSMSAYTSDEIGTAVDAMYAYMHEVVAERSGKLGDDVLSHLIRAREGDDSLNEDELVATIVLLLVAGNETTLKAITRGTLLLLATGQWSRLVDGSVAPEQVVEEVLRHQTPIDTALFRWAKVDTELAGKAIPKGDMVFVSLHLANVDEASREQAAEFLPGRSDDAHLAFGYGAHFCLGAALARAELATAFGALARRFPGLELAEAPEDLRWTAGSMLNSPVALPVRW